MMKWTLEPSGVNFCPLSHNVFPSSTFSLFYRKMVQSRSVSVVKTLISSQFVNLSIHIYYSDECPPGYSYTQ